ncbi:acid protease [Aaosphaeria arxii CBS 175.79]|uniref:Acid protease n=1 Tax=Aaosphaeria arxii CBS 175.79 TaxID=1450172 RepID=A0A6A5XLH7_9PLEO|nr:acid protease [Aaosphaeria arxii CBS 175.79]KAF2013701.1 acid protease [Aaosphaeria arxii CBS 175.79]
MYTKISSWTAACLSLSLLPTATAFYPYHFPSGSDNNAGASRRASIPHAARGPLSLPIRRVQLPRDNIYNIVNSKDPSQANSVAIDQDGNDLSYMVAVTIGDSKEEYHLLLDSAASNTWVMGQECSSEACKTHNLFGVGDSSTLKTDTKTFDITYGTGSVKGNLATDVMHIGSLAGAELNFGLATNVSDEFRAYPMDGILGIGRGDNTQISPKVVEVLSSSNLIDSKLYGIHMSRAKDGLNDGELNFGEPNKERYDGDLNWLKTVPNNVGFWEVNLDDAGVGEKALDFKGMTAIMDTGTSFILMPKDHAVTLHNSVQGTRNSGETFTVPCDTKENLFMAFGGKRYTISTADWVGPKQSDGSCRSNVIGRQTFGDKQWLVGDTFLKNVYSVFDFDNSQVGLGVKGGASSQVPKPSASVGTGSSGNTSPTATGESSSPNASSTGSAPPPTGTISNASPTGAAASSITNPSLQAEATAGASQSSEKPGAAVRASGSTSSVALAIALGLVCLFM